MKTLAVEAASLADCVEAAQSERVVLTRGGRPIALIVGVAGLHREQVELGTSDEFWQLIRERRKEKTLTRSELEKQLRRRRKGR